MSGPELGRVTFKMTPILVRSVQQREVTVNVDIARLTSSDTSSPIIKYPAAPAINDTSVAMIWEVSGRRGAVDMMTHKCKIDHLRDYLES